MKGEDLVTAISNVMTDDQLDAPIPALHMKTTRQLLSEKEGEVKMEPTTEELLKRVVENPNNITWIKRGKLLGQLDKLIGLQMRKLVTLQNLRDAISKQGGNW